MGPRHRRGRRHDPRRHHRLRPGRSSATSSTSRCPQVGDDGERGRGRAASWSRPSPSATSTRRWTARSSRVNEALDAHPRAGQQRPLRRRLALRARASPTTRCRRRPARTPRPTGDARRVASRVVTAGDQDAADRPPDRVSCRFAATSTSAHPEGRDARRRSTMPYCTQLRQREPGRRAVLLPAAVTGWQPPMPRSSPSGRDHHDLASADRPGRLGRPTSTDRSSTRRTPPPSTRSPRDRRCSSCSAGPSAGSRFLLDKDVTTAGRHPDSDIFLDDVTVSRRHAEFRRSGDGFSVADVGSLNGTYVNRDRIDDGRARRTATRCRSASSGCVLRRATMTGAACTARAVAPARRPASSIGEVLADLRPEFPDVTISKIRFLEAEGLVEPERTPSGYRKFSAEDVERLRYVLRDAARPLPAAAGDRRAPRGDRPRACSHRRSSRSCPTVPTSRRSGADGLPSRRVVRRVATTSGSRASELLKIAEIDRGAARRSWRSSGWSLPGRAPATSTPTRW